MQVLLNGSLLRFILSVTGIPGDLMKSLGFLGEIRSLMRLFSEDLHLRDMLSFSISFGLPIAPSLTSLVSCKPVYLSECSPEPEEIPSAQPQDS